MFRPCSQCDELGILRAKVVGQEQETLVYCTCDWWKKQPAQIWKLPNVTPQMQGVFEISKCPLGWFLPNNERASVKRGGLVASMGPIVERWKSRVRAAEAFWREHGITLEACTNYWVERGGLK